MILITYVLNNIDYAFRRLIMCVIMLFQGPAVTADRGLCFGLTRRNASS
jgi:hypothetical protein